MNIRVVHRNLRYRCQCCVDLPNNLAAEGLVVGIDPTATTREFLKSDSCFRVDESGVEIWLALPPWMQQSSSRESRSGLSQAKYLAEGNVEIAGQNMGVLLQVLPANAITSCHSHPSVSGNESGTKEWFQPLLREDCNRPMLGTPSGRKRVPFQGCAVEVGEPHQLKADCGLCINLIYMLPIPEATWMGGHIPYNPPFFDTD